MTIVGLSSIEMTVGETRLVSFRLRKISTGGFLNVNGASKIEVEASSVSSLDERTLPPIVCDRYADGADWVNGLLQVPFSPSDVTARAGTYQYNVLVWNLAGENPVFVGGRQEVTPRNKIEKYVRRDGGAYWTDRVRAGKATADLKAGMPIFYDAEAKTLSPAFATVSGVMLADTVKGYCGLWARAGWVSKLDWSDIHPTVTLLPDSQVGIGLSAGSLISPPVGPVVGVSDVTGTTLSFSL